MTRTEQIRQNPRREIRTLADRKHGDVRLLPIRTWHGREYAVVGHIELTADLQRLAVIDLTSLDMDRPGDDPAIRERIRPARFNAEQPEMEAGPEIWMEEGETLQAFQARTRRHVVVIYPDEGHDSILDNAGQWTWVRLADLPVRVVPGSGADYRAVREQQMDELEQSVDAGGIAN